MLTRQKLPGPKRARPFYVPATGYARSANATLSIGVEARLRPVGAT